MKILHIDDSPEICELYSELYTAENHSIKSVNNGKEGLNLVLQNDYDLILLDMCMPKYSGMEFLEDLKKQRPSELKKIVVTSVLQFDEDQVKGLIKLGVHSVEEKPAHLQELESLQKNMSQPRGKIMSYSRKILIIDDNKDTTTMLSEFFNSQGFETVVINDPWEGLKRIQQEQFDVILLDVIMPQLNGLQIIGTLATDKILQDQNIFIYSANLGNDNQIKDLLRRDGINGCLKKPMDLNEMLKTITKKVILQKTTPSEII